VPFVPAGNQAIMWCENEVADSTMAVAEEEEAWEVVEAEEEPDEPEQEEEVHAAPAADLIEMGIARANYVTLLWPPAIHLSGLPKEVSVPGLSRAGDFGDLDHSPPPECS
jgi:hypothetical protein